MNSQKLIVKLTQLDFSPILVGVESIIQVDSAIVGAVNGKAHQTLCTKIKSRGAMVETCWVTESVEEVWEMINNN